MWWQVVVKFLRELFRATRTTAFTGGSGVRCGRWCWWAGVRDAEERGKGPVSFAQVFPCLGWDGVQCGRAAAAA
eukprot:11281651-Prorocentrum_lima.AAC.1